MKAWLTSRRVNPETQQQFRRRWSQAEKPDSAIATHLIQSDEDTREFISISFWDDADALHWHRAGMRSDGRPDPFADLAHLQWDRSFDVCDPSPGRRRSLRLALPLSIAAVGAGTFLWRQQQRQNRSIITKAAAGRPKWLLPALLGPAGAGLFVLMQWLRSRGKPSGATTHWEEPVPGPAPAPVAPPIWSVPPTSPAPRTSSVPPAPPEPMQSEASPLEALAWERLSAIEQHRLRVREMMTPKPETIEFDADLATAAAKMQQLNVGVLPVMADGQVAGIITDRDLALVMAGADGNLGAQCVGDVMTSVPITIGPDASLQEASQLMAAHKIRRLLVVRGGELVGILSLGDLAVEGGGPDVQDALEEISEPAKPQR